MKQTVVGIFEKGIDAQMAAQSLESNNIASSKIDILNNSDGERLNDSDRSSDKVGNFFSNLFGDSDESHKHTTAARKGWIVTVHANDRQEAERACDILDKSGAVDVEERSAQLKNTPSAGIDSTARTGASNLQGSDTRIPIIEEKTHIGKREAESGGVRLRSRIIERPVEENLRLREEHVHVERNRVDRPANEKDFKSFQQGEMEIREHSEIPVVNKEARVVEEVRVSKDTEMRNETVRGTERKTDVEVDKLPDSDMRREDLGPNGNRGL
ncbi:YsnF/AvaK domain-containing protein [Pontibacter sp. SGAir0037]|uniref:YsnF/AvaK domain-containing protein n=1 Tax=Pontibacter sp. SGAir0037 TaxID=2571030 RepID=UPI0010CD1D82|nr:YsnF/AvaK domain-containing protein [Pontibacter sp. SGAir0037]QCR22045.1 hypothetical protein C1N53_06630 [Pontibacter sp. SGAir0037]